MRLNNNKFLILLFLLTVLSRLFSIYFYGDTDLVNEWRVILLNFENDGIFGSRTVDGEVVPNIFMPPLYGIFLVSLNYFIGNIEILTLTVLYIQLILSTLSVFIIFNILKKFFSKKTCIISTLIFSLFPLHVYSVGQISSITLQIFFLTIFFYFIVKLTEFNNLKYFILLSVISSTLILLRAEFVLFFILSLIYIYFYKKNFKKILISFLLTLILISPYLVRNYIIFDKIVITQSFGYNLWKGNNENLNVDGYYPDLNVNLNKKINDLGYNVKYDLLIDKIYQQEAIEFIKKHPSDITILYFKKIFSFLFLDLNSNYPNYYNFAHIIPKILISFTTLFGMYYGLRNKIFGYFSSYFLINILVISIFFILPRYSLALFPCQIILTSIYFDKFFKNT